MPDAFTEIRAELDSIVGDRTLDATAKLRRLRTIQSRLSSLSGQVSTYMGDVGLVREAEGGDHARKVLAMRANADAREALVEQGHEAAELDAQGFVSHEMLDQLGEEGLLAEAASLWPDGEPA